MPSRSRLKSLKAAFPEGVDYKITYDTTVFVKQSMEEVVHTLVEAFILVVIVVFLFLGNFRATLIPLIAVPVSLIGTFAVMLAVGFSANTVSLLALVLAIGIVVDDAIVVVEAVEAQLEKDHTIDARRSGQPRHGRDHGADHRHHAGAALGVRAGRVHSRHLRRAVPAVRRCGVGVDGDFGDQRADAVAGAVRGVPARRAMGPSAASWATCMRGIDTTRDGYAFVVRKTVRLALCWACWLLVVVMAGAGWLFKVTPTGFLPSEDQGAVFGEIAAAGRRLGQPHRRSDEARRRDHPQHARRGERDVGGRLQPARRAGEIQRRPVDHDAQAVRRAQRRGSCRSTASSRGCPGSSQGIREAIVFAYNLPPIIGLGTGSGFEYQLVSLRGADPAEIAAATRAMVFAANQNPALNRVFTTYSASTPQLYLDLDREKVQTLGVAVSDVFNALQSVLGGYYVNDFNLFGRTWQVNVQGEASERARIDDIYQHQRAQQERRHGAGARLRRCAADSRAAVDRPLQQLPQRHHQRRAGAGPLVGRGARRDGAALADDAAAAATATNGPAPRFRKRRRPARPRSSSGSRCCSPICSWSRCTKAG